MVETGIIHGKFQIFHLKHMEYLLAAKMRCKKLIIGIENPDDRKPFSFYERFEMIREALLDFGVGREEFEILPFPIAAPELLKNYVPKDAVVYMSITGAKSEEKKKTLEEMGFRTEVLWRKEPETKGITGTEIRRLISEGKEWKQFVPKKVYSYIVSHNLDEGIDFKDI